MNGHLLDVTHAWSQRLQGKSSAALAPGEARRCADLLARGLKDRALPFLDMPYLEDLERELPRVAERLRPFRHMLLLGIGGSALGARALQKAFFPQQDRPGHAGPWLWIADNVDPEGFAACLAGLDPRDTALVVVSKSGGTIETMAQYFLARRWLQEALGEAWKDHVVAVTDAASGALRAEADAAGLASLPVPDHLGGRYSALSAVGLVPAAFLGIDWHALCRGARSVCAGLGGGPESLETHPAFALAVWARALMRAGYGQLIFFSYIPPWGCFKDWFSQLWAESLGKEGKGSMPVPALGVTDQHSTNQMFLDGPRDKGCLFLSCAAMPAGPVFGSDLPPKWAFLQGRPFGDLLEAEALGTRMALTRHGVPLVHLRMAQADEEAAGHLMGLLMAATLLTGWLLEINPLDQPAVELGKQLANARLGAPGLDAETAALNAFLREEETSAGKQSF